MQEVLIDTSVWSLALRRPKDKLNAIELRTVTAAQRLFADDDAALLGLVRQELLSGIRDEKRYETLRLLLRDWEDEPISIVDHENAAACWNQCAAAGIAASTVDLLICAVAIRRLMPIFTTDPDFNRYAKVLPIRFYQIPSDITGGA